MFRTCKTFLAQIFKWPNKRKDCSDFVTFQPLSRIYNLFFKKILLYILFRSCYFPTFALTLLLHRINNNNNNNNLLLQILPLQILQLQILQSQILQSQILQSQILHYMFYPRGLRLNLVLVLLLARF